jgi:endonuclease YncB( thermonuclease family)
MDRLSRVLASIVICLPSLVASRGSFAGDDDVLWPQNPIRIDRSKQHYERLPPAQQAIDTRIWVMVPDRIQVLDSARFSFGGRPYRIAGVRPVSLTRICRDVDVGRWSCGRMAGIFLGNLVRGKRLLCDVAAGAKETVLTRCQTATKDLAVEIVANGYGRADTDGLLTSTEELARSKRAGLWRNPDCVLDFDHC